MPSPKFPAPIDVNGRTFFDRYEVERYKHELIGKAAPPRDPRAPIEFVQSSKVLAELDISSRTLMRRLAEHQAA